MTFREMAFDEELRLPGFRNAEEEGAVKSMMRNLSPIMKLWFGIMMINLVVFLFIL